MLFGFQVISLELLLMSIYTREGLLSSPPEFSEEYSPRLTESGLACNKMERFGVHNQEGKMGAEGKFGKFGTFIQWDAASALRI